MSFHGNGSTELQAATHVLTHHYDGQRTGWNSQETILTPASLRSGSFGQHLTVPVDDQIDAQPLIVTDQPISGVQGNRTVVYVVTESNTVDAIDASTGTVLLTTNLGPPVPQSAVGGCTNNATNIGISSTPVIDRSTGTLYVIAYTFDGQAATYTLHALDLSTLADTLPPVVVTASQMLSDGTIYTFDPATSRQRAALLEANGNIYAAFSSFCDFFADRSRGWVLGWSASSLQPLPTDHLNDILANAPSNYFLSAVWMSGSGPAVSADGSLFFVTGNSDPLGSYDSVRNLSESLVRVAGDLSGVVDFFTPSQVGSLDQGDVDFGAGGVMLLPPQPGVVPDLAVAAGKDGNMYLVDRQNLGGFTPGGPDNVLGTFDIGGACWCAPSYFARADGVGRIVSSGGSSAIVWQVVISPTAPTVTLVQESSTGPLDTGQDGGFFTSVSSNATQDGTALIWAVSRPVDAVTAAVTLFAFDPRDGSTVFSAPAGTWPSPGNANIVPVVANGQVYVASSKQLAIFGLASAPASLIALPIDLTHPFTGPLDRPPPPPAGAAEAKPMIALTGPLDRPPSLPIAAEAKPAIALTGPLDRPPSPPAVAEVKPAIAAASVQDNWLSGTVLEMRGAKLTVATRNGHIAQVDTTLAQLAHRSVVLFVGEAITVSGSYHGHGVLVAQMVLRAKPSPALWPPDQ